MEGSATTNIGAGDPVAADPRDQEIADLRAQVAALQADEAAEAAALKQPVAAGYAGAERRVASGPRRTGPADRRSDAGAAEPALSGVDPMGAPVDHNPEP